MASVNWSRVRRARGEGIATLPVARDEQPDHFTTREEWADWVKSYYREMESYDWVDVADNFRGPEAIFHRYRAHVVRRLVGVFLSDVPILDAGCGTGLNLRGLPAGSVGLDINPRNLEVVGMRYPQYKTVLADIEDMPFDDGQFGGVLCTEVLEHVPNPDMALREIMRVLEPGGVLIGSVPSLSPLWKLRFISRTCEGCEPFHHQYRVSDISGMLAEFEQVSARSSVLGTSVVFVAQKPR